MDTFDKKLEDILIYRKPEFWLNDIFNKLEIWQDKIIPEILYYIKDKIVLFQYDGRINRFYYDYDNIYLILKNKYKCNENNMFLLINSNVKKILNIDAKSVYTVDILRFH